MITLVACNRPEAVYPPFDGSSKLTEVQHVYRDDQNPDLILRQVIFSIYYNSQGKVSECFEGDRLLYRCTYDGNLLTQVETDFYSESPATVFDITYSDDRVNSVTYTFESNFSITMYYKYVSENEFTRFDTTGIEGDIVYNMVHFTEEKVESVQINPFNTYSFTENFTYTKIPSFVSVFGFPTLPMYQVYLPLGLTAIPSEILQIADYLPSEKEGDNGIHETYEYEFSDGLVRKIYINSLITGQKYEVVLIWN